MSGVRLLLVALNIPSDSISGPTPSGVSLYKHNEVTTMSIPVLITDGQNNLAFANGAMPVYLGNITLVDGAIPVSANLEGTTVNATFPATVNAAITNNITVNDVISTVNVAIVSDAADIFSQEDSGVFDAFGRQRMSQPVTLFQSMLAADNGSAYWDELETGTANGTTSTWTQNSASVALTVNASVNTTRVRQTFERLPYQPGKSQQVMVSFVPGSTINGVNKEVGYGDESDGLFFQTVNNGIGVCRRTTVNGTKVDNYVAQADWNLDTLNGAGASGYTLEVTKAQILFMDFEWLGVGRARLGFVIDGKIIYCHAFNNANNLSTVYMRTPVLPVRYSISGNGSQAAPTTLTVICASVATEGGEELVGRPRSTSTGTSAIVATANWTILKAIRIGSDGKSARPREITAEVICTDTNAMAEYCLMLQPTVAGGSLTWTDVDSSKIEHATGNASLYASAGTVLHTAYAAGRSVGSLGGGARVSLGFTINGTQRVLALCARLLSGTPDLHAAINWIET